VKDCSKLWLGKIGIGKFDKIGQRGEQRYQSQGRKRLEGKRKEDATPEEKSCKHGLMATQSENVFLHKKVRGPDAAAGHSSHAGKESGTSVKRARPSS